MVSILWLLVYLGIIIFVFQKLRRIGKQDNKHEFLNAVDNFELLPTLMNSGERKIFEMLRPVLENKYDLYPQVHLNHIFRVKSSLYGYKNKLFNLRRINQKSVDFLAVNKSTQSPAFAIEVDSFYHERKDRRERDWFVENLFKSVNFPLIRIDNRTDLNEDNLRKLFERYLV